MKLEFPSELPLTRYEKVEMLVFGIVLPILLVIWTLHRLLVDSEAIYLFHDEYTYYTGVAAYLVCWFWFGLALALFAHFVLAKKKRHYTLARKHFRFGVLLTFSGTLAAIWDTYDLNLLVP